MSALRTGTYELEFNTLVQAKVQASNEYGWSPFSEANTIGA